MKQRAVIMWETIQSFKTVSIMLTIGVAYWQTVTSITTAAVSWLMGCNEVISSTSWKVNCCCHWNFRSSKSVFKNLRPMSYTVRHLFFVASSSKPKWCSHYDDATFVIFEVIVLCCTMYFHCCRKICRHLHIIKWRKIQDVIHQI